jgi:hypothetical protein
MDMVACLVLMFAKIRPESVEDPKECRRRAGERREKIRDLLLDLLTGSEISSQDLAHFRFVANALAGHPTYLDTQQSSTPLY